MTLVQPKCEKEHDNTNEVDQP